MDTTVNQILEEASDLYRRKENDYGESWKLTGEIMAMMLQQSDKDEITIPADPEYLSALALYTRRLDKFVRSFNGTFTQDELEVDESVSETVKDQIPYAAMQTAIAKDLQTAYSENREQYLDCPKCGQEAVDRTSLISKSNDEYEYYCTCGHAWWDE